MFGYTHIYKWRIVRLCSTCRIPHFISLLFLFLHIHCLQFVKRCFSQKSNQQMKKGPSDASGGFIYNEIDKIFGK